MKQYLIFLSFVFLSCHFSSKQDEKAINSDVSYQKGNTSYCNVKQKTIEKTVEENDYKKEIQFFAPIDTVSLCTFWVNFQNNLRNENKQKVIDILEYPIHAIFSVLFKYAHDCDTLAYIKGEEQYGDFDIDKDNILEYYDFLFTDVLKEVIYRTSVDDLLAKGIRYKKYSGMTYTFFPKDYGIKVNCPNDHNMKFGISNEDNGWKIEIGGL